MLFVPGLTRVQLMAPILQPAGTAHLLQDAVALSLNLKHLNCPTWENLHWTEGLECGDSI
jgi:hypothetical protein